MNKWFKYIVYHGRSKMSLDRPRFGLNDRCKHLIAQLKREW